MLDPKTVSALLKRYQVNLHRRGVKSLAMFGCFEQSKANPASDVDMLMKFNTR